MRIFYSFLSFLHMIHHVGVLDAAFAAGQRALKAGIKNPWISFADPPTGTRLGWLHQNDQDEYAHFAEVTLLGLLEAAYEPIDAREHAERVGKPLPVFEQLTLSVSSTYLDQAILVDRVVAIETGRRVAKGKCQEFVFVFHCYAHKS